MSLYHLQRAVFDFLRAGEEGWSHGFNPEAYDLTPREREVLEARDIRGLAELGVHPVLINGFARAIGSTRDEYRRLLRGSESDLDSGNERSARWLKS